MQLATEAPPGLLSRRSCQPCERCSTVFHLQIYPTADFPTFDAALRHFLSDAGVEDSEVYSCCIACAGPVLANKCVMTNLQWTVDGAAITERHGFRTAVRLCDRTHAHHEW